MSSTICERINHLIELLPSENPVGFLFKTKCKNYYYDTPTGKIIVCGDTEFLLLEKILYGEPKKRKALIMEKQHLDDFGLAIDNISGAVQSENILRIAKFKQMSLPEGYNDLPKQSVRQLIIELTERCNLRCTYCTYNSACDGDRDFGERDITEADMLRAIDFLCAHSADSKELSISFYGGEPLLRYDLMMKCIDYSTGRIKDKELSFSLTTNCMLVTPEMARELAEVENLSIVVSIDGPKEIHDMYRKDIRGMGSYDRSIKGFKHLVEAFGERAKHFLSVNAVYSPPFSTEKVEAVKSFFTSLEWFPEELAVNATYPRNESVHMIKSHRNKNKIQNAILNSDYFDNSLFVWAIENYDVESSFLKQSLNQQFNRIFTRKISNISEGWLPLNGCCSPGQRRLYVTVDGDFKICERMGSAPTIGNLDNGFDSDRIKTIYIDGYASKSYENCSVCWIGRLCDICYSICCDAFGLNMAKKDANCVQRKHIYSNLLVSYFEILEKDSHAFDTLVEVNAK